MLAEVGRVLSVKHVTVDELNELLENIARVNSISPRGS
jgi:hypothetical protein